MVQEYFFSLDRLAPQRDRLGREYFPRLDILCTLPAYGVYNYLNYI